MLPPVVHVLKSATRDKAANLTSRVDPTCRNTTALVVRHPDRDASPRSTHAADFKPLTTVSVVYCLARALDLLVKLLPELLLEFVYRPDLQAKLVKRDVSHQVQAIEKDQQ